MKIINVQNKYNTYLTDNFDNLAELLTNYKKIYIIIDDNVAQIYLNELIENIKINKIYSYIIPHGEHNKTLETVRNIYDDMIKKNIDRASLIVAFGGGVVGDIAGFVASTYMRGIHFIQIPSTLLAQVDSSVGGKVGVDLLDKKNIIGSFYNPMLVYININLLKTLPIHQFENGMAEVIKYGYILDKSYLDFITEQIDNIKKQDYSVLKNIIYKSCNIKAQVVIKDEKENGIRQILNFGHTIGHAIETTTKFGILHGQAICIGMIACLYLSETLGFINGESERAKLLFKKFNLYESLDIDTEEIYANMMYDKKNKDDKITIILIKNIGEAFAKNNIPKSDIITAIKYALEG